MKMMPDKVNNRLIVKNAILLYIRMLLIMAVSFFTTRVVLQTLGVTDYGIYNTIAGVVVMFAFLNSAMVAATQRFLNYNLGKENEKDAAVDFNISLVVHIAIAVVVAILSEVIGLSFLYTKMQLPPERFNAAFWTLHFSVAVTFINIIRSPYNACIIAYERMDFYAYISILESAAKLLIVYLLLVVHSDKLIVYSALVLVVSLLVTWIYKMFCNHNFYISHYLSIWDKKAFKRIMSFSGFSVMGNAANVVAQQGQNMLLNVFVGVVANAAASVSNQLSSGVYSFCNNFQIAFNPQLVKSYARGAFEEMRVLICRMSRLSYYLMFIITLPLLTYNNQFLHLWLDEVPTHTSDFCVLTMLFLLIDSVAAPLWITVQASGKIQRYQTVICLLVISNIPMSWIFLALGFPPVSVFIVRLCINFCAYLYRYHYAHRLVQLSFVQYCRSFLFPVIRVSLICVLASWMLYMSGVHYMLSSLLIIAVTAISIFLLGLSRGEQTMVMTTIKNKIRFYRI